VTDNAGLPLAIAITAANTPDGMLLAAMVDDVPAVRTPSGQRRHRPDKLHADKAYDSRANRAALRRRGITSRVARRGVESSQRLGPHRWRIERSLSWLGCWRRLQVRWDRDSGRFFAFALVACALACFNQLEPAHRSDVRLR
jgi:transposase